MARDFFARQGDLTPQYFVYCEEKQRRMAEIDPPFGHVDIVQSRPSIPQRGGFRNAWEFLRKKLFR